MSQQLLDYKKTAERWQRYGEEYHHEARTYLIEVSKIALTLASVLFGFLGVFLQAENIKISPVEVKIILSISLLLLATSILPGILLFIKTHRFLNRAGDYYETTSANLFKFMIDNNVRGGFEYPPEVNQNLTIEYHMKPTLLDIQLINLATAIFTSMVAFILYLFS